ncbi:hypothetical protein GLOTRDRAFT_47557 [Gloeophyllum trabeum ATCC 11539]|uniref:Uncharacterized protein n=1 Tax=Gloeophyllum trabeum (strain ATCC 11539 / FP-39264 / Madison 617) TaxID=670483 RepID=S7PXH3_GLOTA|nr:uncharacterized protein GLOTRDRAFT_47557 [Gloeophyllum trabeum ATCC 11539]EPQ52316.1 hypothetical protein GLOTRDRAFT_47557 [Gloeophyllum trabeum ATCC 11539]
MARHHSVRHFKNGIPFVSQWTGTEHKEMEKVFVPMLSGAIQPRALQAARAVVDFIYFASFHQHTSESLGRMEQALADFHEYKDIFITLGRRDHFNIPKLHSMLHYQAAIRLLGSCDGYNTESPERLHIDYAKDAYRASNKRDYTEQMAHWLSRQEAVTEFDKYIRWAIAGPLVAQDSSDEDMNSDDESDSDERLARAPAAPRLAVATYLDHQLSLPRHPSVPSVTVNCIQRDYKAEFFLDALSVYLNKMRPADARHLLSPDGVDRFDVYKQVTIVRPRVLVITNALKLRDKVRAVPAKRAKRGTALIPGHFDMALVRVEGVSSLNPHTAGTFLEGLQVAQVRLLFQLPEYLRYHPRQPVDLAYVEWMTLFSAQDPLTYTHSVSRSTRRGGQRNAEIIPISRIVHSCHLIPKFGTECNRAWTADIAVENCKSFILNRWLDVATFYEFQPRDFYALRL